MEEEFQWKSKDHSQAHLGYRGFVYQRDWWSTSCPSSCWCPEGLFTITSLKPDSLPFSPMKHDLVLPYPEFHIGTFGWSSCSVPRFQQGIPCCFILALCSPNDESKIFVQFLEKGIYLCSLAFRALNCQVLYAQLQTNPAGEDEVQCRGGHWQVPEPENA